MISKSDDGQNSSDIQKPNIFKSRFFGIFVILILALALPLTIYLNQREQDLRQQALSLPIDTLDYFISKHPDTALTGSHPLTQTVAGNTSYYVKFNNPNTYEAYTWDDNYIYLNEDHVEDPTEWNIYSFTPGVWLKRQMAVGETIDMRNSQIQYYNNSCQEIPSNRIGYPSGSFRYEMLLESHNPSLNIDNTPGITNEREVSIGTGDLGNQDVIVVRYDYFAGNFERFYYSREWGWIMWEIYANNKLTNRAVFNKKLNGKVFPNTNVCNPLLEPVTITPTLQGFASAGSADGELLNLFRYEWNSMSYDPLPEQTSSQHKFAWMVGKLDHRGDGLSCLSNCNNNQIDSIYQAEEPKIRSILSRNINRGGVWIVGNEANYNPKIDPAVHSRQFLLYRNLIKSLDPNARLAHSGLLYLGDSSTAASDPISYLEEFLGSLPQNEWPDIYNAHYYPNGTNVSNYQKNILQAREFHSYINSKDPGKAIWVTEFGMNIPSPNATENDAINYMNYMVPAFVNENLAQRWFWFLGSNDPNWTPTLLANQGRLTTVGEEYKRLINFYTPPAIEPTPIPTPTEPDQIPPTPTQTPGPIQSPTPVPTTRLNPSPTPTNPSQTPTPTGIYLYQNTEISFSFTLDGIGPTGNKNPIFPNKHYTIEITDSQNSTVLTMEGIVDNYNSLSGVFTDSLTIDNESKIFNTGTYAVKIKIDGFLKTLFPGIQTITSKTTNQLPIVNLPAGDLNNDNRITVIDWNISISCINTSSGCQSSDLNDDGIKNILDINLIRNNLNTRFGD